MTDRIASEADEAKSEQRTARDELLRASEILTNAGELPSAVSCFLTAVREYLHAEIALEDRELEDRAAKDLLALRLLQRVRA